MKVDIQGIDHKGNLVLSKIDKIDEALRQVLDNKSAIFLSRFCKRNLQQLQTPISTHNRSSEPSCQSQNSNYHPSSYSESNAYSTQTSRFKRASHVMFTWPLFSEERKWPRRYLGLEYPIRRVWTSTLRGFCGLLSCGLSFGRIILFHSMELGWSRLEGIIISSCEWG
ncbi:hypothetical protein AG1IA_10026 [Rhizoctonia solani AG-1 IA]|uniref:Uncharacterized protein n=1 Tax=Thanatephorus cucumeris (strain AG1-IA) TaxID=983506 RepID=L8WHT5_THACA|nr:hypothetical protein AG1IA_10026 [Rhizoctonia solani AG-1 IA]